MIIDKLHPILRRFRAPEPGDDGGGKEDRGDDFVPTDDDEGGDKGGKDAKDAKDGADKDDVEEEDKDEEGDGKGAKAKKDAKDDVEEEEEGDGKDKKKPGGLPWSRHKEILAKEREAREEAERKLAQYEGGTRVAATNERITKIEEKILAADKELTKLLTDGDHEKAAEKRREIRGLENEVIELKSDMKAAAASAQAVEKMRYDITVERLETAYPVLNPDHDDFDEEKAQDVMDLAASYRTRRNMTPAEAIQKAAKKLLGAETKKQEDATTVKARVDKEEAEEAAAKEKEAERRKSQVKKNLEADKKQPPDTTKRGADSDKAGGGVSAKDVLKMSQDDFNKLDEATLARMRGDVIA